MYNFKSFGRTFKGLAGECMFQLTRSNSYITIYHELKFVLKKYSKRLTKDQIIFITNNWFSFDAIEFGENVTIYEVKTRNVENHKAKFRLKITQNCMNIYSEAEKLGFKVKVATILLCDDWNYSILIDNFSYLKNKIWIYTKNKHDKTTESYKKLINPININ